MRTLLSNEHFSVDGTQIAAWASMKSFRAKDRSDEPSLDGRNGERDFHGEKRSNDTHVSTTDPEAKLYRKGSGKEAKLSYTGQRHDRKSSWPGGRGRVRRGERNDRTRGGAVNGSIGNNSERCVAPRSWSSRSFVSIWAIAHSPGFRGLRL